MEMELKLEMKRYEEQSVNRKRRTRKKRMRRGDRGGEQRVGIDRTSSTKKEKEDGLKEVKDS